MRKIGIDIDDVLLELTQAFIKYHNETYGTQLTFKEFTSYYLPKVIGGTFNEAVAKLDNVNQTHYSFNLKPVPEAREAITRLQEKARLSVITSRSTKLFSITRQQVQNHFPGSLADSIYFARNPYLSSSGLTKKDLCLKLEISTLFEDSLEHARECAAAGIQVYLIDYPWNQLQEEIPGVTRLTKGWAELLPLLES